MNWKDLPVGTTFEMISAKWLVILDQHGEKAHVPLDAVYKNDNAREIRVIEGVAQWK